MLQILTQKGLVFESELLEGEAEDLGHALAKARETSALFETEGCEVTLWAVPEEGNDKHLGTWVNGKRLN